MAISGLISAQATLMRSLFFRRTAVALLLLALLLASFVMLYAGKPFWLDFCTRLVILAIAASSLSLLLSVAGLASFGHAAYVGLDAYAVGIPVILDDATEGLAPQVRAAIWQSLTTLKKTGLGILLVDKHVRDILPLVDRHRIMEKGRIVWSGDRYDWNSQPDVHDKYLSI